MRDGLLIRIKADHNQRQLILLHTSQSPDRLLIKQVICSDDGSTSVTLFCPSWCFLSFIISQQRLNYAGVNCTVNTVFIQIFSNIFFINNISNNYHTCFCDISCFSGIAARRSGWWTSKYVHLTVLHCDILPYFGRTIHDKRLYFYPDVVVGY